MGTARRRALIVVLLALCGVAGASAALAGAFSPPGVVTESGGTVRSAAIVVRPREIVYSGDGSALLAGASSLHGALRWTAWSERSGVAGGADWRDDCRPSCAAGHYRAYLARVTVSRPRTIDGRRTFTRLTIRYLHAVPPDRGVHRTTTLPLVRSHSVLYWGR